MARILITGGAGFIGSHLIEQLSPAHELVVLDDLSTGHRGNVPDEVVFFQGDCRNRAHLDKASAGCEFIYHLASTVGVEKVVRNPAACIQNILESTKAVLSLGIPGMDFSTSEVYGKNTNPLTEDVDLIYSSKGRWSYATSKLIGEWLAKDAGWKTVRLFNIVGPRQNLGYVFSNFVHQAKHGQPITLYGTGDQVRTFSDVRDTVGILDKLRDKEFDVVNVGADHTMSMRQLAHLVKRVLHSSSDIVTVPYQAVYSAGFEDCPSRIPDLTKLHGLVGEVEYSSIEKMILDTAEER